MLEWCEDPENLDLWITVPVCPLYVVCPIYVQYIVGVAEDVDLWITVPKTNEITIYRKLLFT